MSTCFIGRCGTLSVTILAVVETVLGFGWHTERSAKAIALYIGAAAKWTRIKFGVTHVSNSAVVDTRAGALERHRTVLIRERRIVSVGSEAPPVHKVTRAPAPEATQ
jgi:hypothetical protein